MRKRRLNIDCFSLIIKKEQEVDCLEDYQEKRIGDDL